MDSTLYNNILTQIRLTLIILGFISVSIFFSLSQGSSSHALFDLFSHNESSAALELLKLRAIRTVAAFTTGGLLSLAGALMQALLQNPLADPYILGISGGAAIGILLSMLLGISGGLLIGGAWVGSLITVLIILALARIHRWQPHALILTSISLACFYSAIITLLLLLTPHLALHSMLFWLTGDLNNADFSWLTVTIFLLGLLSSFLLAPGLNILVRGEDAAKLLGLSTRSFKIWLYLLSSLLTAAAVSTAGCLGFIGLLVPHLTRQLAGFDHRHNLPLAMLLGGALLTIADTLSRFLIAPMQLPVGMLLALFGAPTLIFLIRR